MKRNPWRFAPIVGLLAIFVAGASRADCLPTPGVIGDCTVWGDQLVMPPLWPAWRVAHIHYVRRHTGHHRHHAAS